MIIEIAGGEGLNHESRKLVEKLSSAVRKDVNGALTATDFLIKPSPTPVDPSPSVKYRMSEVASNSVVRNNLSGKKLENGQIVETLLQAPVNVNEGVKLNNEYAKVLDYEIEGINASLSDLSFGENAGGKNLFSGGTVSGTQYKLVQLSHNIPKGTYTLSANTVSSDTDKTKCLIRFLNSGSGVGDAYITRGNRVSTQITLTGDCDSIYFYASDSASTSSGDTFTFSDIQIEEGSVATNYEPFIMSNNQLTRLSADAIDNTWYQGYRDASNNIVNSKNYICIGIFKCEPNNRIDVYTEKTYKQIIVRLSDGSYIGDSSVTTAHNHIQGNIPSNVTSFSLYVSNGTTEEIVQTNGGKIYCYSNGVLLNTKINSTIYEVDKLKADLAISKFETDTASSVNVNTQYFGSNFHLSLMKMNGIVFICGRFQRNSAVLPDRATSATSVFTIPSGFRPQQNTMASLTIDRGVGSFGFGGATDVRIKSSGEFVPIYDSETAFPHDTYATFNGWYLI